MEQILESRPFHYEHFRSAQLNVDLRIANCCNLAQEVMKGRSAKTLAKF